MTQMKFLSNGKIVSESKTLSKIVGLRFYEASSTLKVGQTVEVRPVEVKGFKNVLGVFNSKGQVGNIISKKTENELIYEATRKGQVLNNHQLANGLNGLTFKVKSIGKYGAVLTVSL